MPPDLPNEQELILKKRARRRLVGAVALVLLMIIILPQVLQDRALLAQQEPIKITMPVVTYPANQQPVLQDITVAEQRNTVVDVADDKVPEFKEPVTEHVGITPPENKPAKEVDKKVAIKTPEVSKTQTPIKPQESFTVQVGVYSDADNVKRLQDQLKQAGFSTYTEQVKTPKGDSLRLKAGNFKSREDAVTALAKIKAIGLSGIVIGND